VISVAIGKAIGVALIVLFFWWLFRRADRKDAEDAARKSRDIEQR
jgi:cbb3-type cytochrome oxidase subunit 3